ncbi:Holliday junction branch migration protein RuvA [Bacillus piscicola]|uniref:Holliday junction branch migration protein RuvA n=1 Tax=Bacillus piscicola TaxID=1632684 RepID=UPI001F08FB21|nr:Holliday junction branch migration protein RuvA [Bacillus piscicola]
MFEFIRGSIVHTEKETVTLKVNNVGFLVHCANPFVFTEDEKEVTIYTYQYVKEDAIRLYGFPSREERSLFEQLLQVSGIGPKGALAILAAGAPLQVMQAIEDENEKFLTKFPGVGKKTARQMILDLKGKLHGIIKDPSLPDGPQPENGEENQALEEALEALRALGYGEKEIKKVKPKIQDDLISADEYVKKALQLMLS